MKMDSRPRPSRHNKFIPLSPGSQYESVTSLVEVEKTNRMETPLGDRDQREKIQICVELRSETTNKKSKKRDLKLDVVILQTKYLQAANNNPTHVKISLLPDNVLMSTDPKENQNQSDNCFYAEPVKFQVNEKEGLDGKTLKVEVCDKKVTRNSHCYGSTCVQLDNLKLDQPIIEWYYLEK